MSIQRIILVLAALCAATLISGAQVRAVVIQGAGPDRQTDLESALMFQQTFNADSLDQTVIRWYAIRGFFRTSISSTVIRSDTLEMAIEEGPIAIIRDMTIRGTPAELMTVDPEVLQSRPGAVFTQEAVESDIAAMLLQSEQNGRMLARIEVDDLQEERAGDTTWIRVVLLLDIGPEVRIGEVQFTGNATTRSSTLRTASGIHVGDLWRPGLAENIRRRLLRTQLFSSVDEPRVELTADQRAAVTVSVTENRHNSFDGILGYQPASVGSAKGVVTGLVNLQFRNLLGTGRRLAVRWYQERQGRHEVDLAYREPWLFGSQLAAGIEMHQRRQDSLYVRLRYAAEIRGDINEEMTVGAHLSRSTTTPQEGYGARVMNGSSQTLAGLSFSYDTRDHPITPRRGSFYATDYSTGRKNVGGAAGSSGHPTQRLRFDLGFYVSPFRMQTGLVEAHWSEVRSGAIDAADLGRLGGASDLRGYREGEFLGSRLAWGTVEYRFFLAELSYVGMFVDAGSIHRPDISSVGLTASDVFRVGTGMTMRVDTPVGLIGVSIAVGKGDGFGDAKLHVRIQNEF